MLSLSQTQARVVQGKELVPLFHLICLLPNLTAGLPASCQVAGWDTRVNPLPCPLLSSVHWIPRSPAASPLRRRGHLYDWAERESCHLVLPTVLCHKIDPWKGASEGKGQKLIKKKKQQKTVEGEKGNLIGAARAQCAGWRELHRAGKEAFCLVTVPPEAQRLKIKTGTSFHVCVQCLMMVL